MTVFFKLTAKCPHPLVLQLVVAVQQVGLQKAGGGQAQPQHGHQKGAGKERVVDVAGKDGGQRDEGEAQLAGGGAGALLVEDETFVPQRIGKFSFIEKAEKSKEPEEQKQKAFSGKKAQNPQQAEQPQPAKAWVYAAGAGVLFRGLFSCGVGRQKKVDAVEKQEEEGQDQNSFPNGQVAPGQKVDEQGSGDGNAIKHNQNTRKGETAHKISSSIKVIYLSLNRTNISLFSSEVNPVF